MLHKQGFLTSGRALQWTRVDGDNDDDDVWDLERRDGTATMIARNTEYSHFALELANISQTPQSLANALSSITVLCQINTANVASTSLATFQPIPGDVTHLRLTSQRRLPPKRSSRGRNTSIV